jgi:hypothetical protein
MTNKTGDKPQVDSNRTDDRERGMHAPGRDGSGGGRRRDHTADERRTTRIIEDPDVTHHTVGHHHTD